MKEPDRRKNAIGAGITGIVIAIAVISGLVVVGYFIFITLAMASYGSNK